MRLQTLPLIGLVLSGFSGCASIDWGPVPAAPVSPEREYREAFEQYLAAHARLTGGADPDLAQRCVDELARMRGLAAEPHRAGLDEWIKKYKELRDKAARKEPVPERGELAPWAQTIRASHAPDRIALAIPLAHPVAAKTRAFDPSRPPSGSPPTWLYIAAWQQLHAELKRRWAAGEDCGETFDLLIDALERLKSALPADMTVKLASYIDSYRAAHTATSGFTAVPAGETREDVSNDLKALETAIRAHYPG